MFLVLWSLAWLSAFGLVGAFNTPWWFPGALWAGLPAATSVARRRLPVRYESAVLLTAAVFALLGGARAGAFVSRPPPPLAQHVGEAKSLLATVDSEPSRGLTTVRYAVSVKSIEDESGHHSTSGRLLLTLGEYERLAPGTTVRLRGMISEPPELADFDYSAFLLRKGIVGTMYRPELTVIATPGRLAPRRFIAAVRDRLDIGLARSLPEPEAALASGLLMGRDDALSEEVTEAFRRSGLAHIVAVSGANVVVVTALVFAVGSPLAGRRRALLPAGTAVVAYVFLAGAGWSIIRAALMACIYLGGEYAGRARSSLPALAAAAVVITAIRPAASFDVGFQLSLAATAGLITCGPWVRFLLLSAAGSAGRSILPRTIFEVLALTISATFATLPVTWAVFGRVSLVSPLANVVVEPLFAVALVCSGITAALSLVSPSFGWAAGIPAYYPLHYMVSTAETLSRWEMASVAPGRIDARSAVLACGLLTLGTWPAYRYLPPDLPRPARFRWARAVRTGALAALGSGLAVSVVCTSLLPLRGPAKLRLVVLNVGQGDAILITTPHGRNLVVDGGPSGIRLTQELGRVLPHWTRTIDVAVLSHPQEDHAAGFRRLLDVRKVNLLLDSGAEGTSHIARSVLASAPARRTVGAGSRFTLDGVLFEVLWPPPGLEADDVNEASVVLRVGYAGRTVLLTGDLEGDALRTLADGRGVRTDVLKVPHHGSATTPAWFFERVNPSLALISVGAGNRFGHPAPGTLAALGGTTVLRTDLEGRLTVAIGKEGISVKTEARPERLLPVE